MPCLNMNGVSAHLLNNLSFNLYVIDAPKIPNIMLETRSHEMVCTFRFTQVSWCVDFMKLYS